MRILMTTPFLPSASKTGVGYQAHDMANELVRRGHAVTVASPCARAEGSLYEYAPMVGRPPFRTVRMPWRIRASDWSKYDVVHAHGEDWCLWNKAVPRHIRTMHGTCLQEAAQLRRPRHVSRMLWLAGLEVVSSAVADVTVAVSRNTCRVYPWIRQVIPNGINLERFHPGPKEAEPTILFVGTYQFRKRGILLHQAFSRVIRRRIPTAKLWMVSDDAPGAAGIEVLGRISGQELQSRYRRAWVFCLPSRYEGFGIPYIEAMASGTAVVATPNPGSMEVLDGGRYGMICEPAALGTVISELLLDGPRRQALAAEGLRRAQIYSWDNVLPLYERLYRGGR